MSTTATSKEDLEHQRKIEEIRAKDEAYLNEDVDMIELHDSSTKVSAVTVSKVLTTLAAPFSIAAAIAFSSIKDKNYGNGFTDWTTIMTTGAVSACVWTLLYFS